MAEHSIIEYYGAQIKESCGYCHQAATSHSHSMWAHFLTVGDYQDLIDRGWRRSGKHCYKPTMSATCCPCYTIRCQARTFKPTKSQKKVIKRVNRMLMDGKPDGKVVAKQKVPNEVNVSAEDESSDFDGSCADPMAGYADRGDQHMDLSDVIVSADDTGAQTVAVQPDELTATDDQKQPTVAEQQPESVPMATTATTTPSAPKPLQKKAKLMRLERRAAKMAQKPPSNTELPIVVPAKNVEKTFAQLLADCEHPNGKHKLRLELVPAKQSLEQTPDVLRLYQKYQMIVHGDKFNTLTAKSFERFLVASPFEITHTADGPAAGYGTFHHQYWLDDCLIAVGVLDILPRCVSAVYFFYDPSWRSLSLGTYSAFREMQLVCELSERTPAIDSYYMGFYIHSCPKMRYKAHMKPSELLCPEVYTWHRLDDALTAKLDAKQYQRLNQALDADDGNAFDADRGVNDVRLLNRYTLVSFLQLMRAGTDDKRKATKAKEDIKEFGEVVGCKLSKRLVYFLK